MNQVRVNVLLLLNFSPHEKLDTMLINMRDLVSESSTNRLLRSYLIWGEHL